MSLRTNLCYRANHRASRSAVVKAATVASVAAAAVSVVVAVGPDAQAGPPLNVTASTLSVSMRGNGHGHGLSQYGAQGAAMKGLSWRQIVGFYYPHATLRQVRPTLIRVAVSGFGTNVAVAAANGLEVSGVHGWLPTKGVARYRLLSNAGSGLRLQKLPSGRNQHWQTINGSLGNGASFHSAFYGAVRTFMPNGSSIAYSGFVRAVRTTPTGFGHGTYTVNLASIDSYTGGVVPREMPDGWRRPALDAQAVAARTYARWQMDNPRSSAYDICDTTMCQVYGGVAKYDAAGHVLWRDDMRPAMDTARQVLFYGGHAIFSQFSASNGGWTVDGGQPYLVAKADPYDAAGGGDPYSYYSQRVPVGQVANYYGLSRVTKLQITGRDGHGTGGGRATSVLVWGYRNGKAVRISTDGSELAGALGAGTTWITLRNG